MWHVYKKWVTKKVKNNSCTTIKNYSYHTSYAHAPIQSSHSTIVFPWCSVEYFRTNFITSDSRWRILSDCDREPFRSKCFSWEVSDSIFLSTRGWNADFDSLRFEWRRDSFLNLSNSALCFAALSAANSSQNKQICVYIITVFVNTVDPRNKIKGSVATLTFGSNWWLFTYYLL